MCGIAGIFGNDWKPEQLNAMHSVQRHRGPDDEGIYLDPAKLAGLAHNRLSIIDLSEAGRQPLNCGKFWIAFNGEIYNYLELRRELESEFVFRTQTDTEVILAAYQKWGPAFLDKLVGMFAFLIWDENEKTAFAARDRFGVKPLYFHRKNDGTIFLSSEIKALHAAGVELAPNPQAWANYLSFGLTDYAPETFWKNVHSVPAGFALKWRAGGKIHFSRWYDIAHQSGFDFDRRSEREVQKEYLELMRESVRLRFRSDVPVGINLSGGLDSSSLLSIVEQSRNGAESVKAFTFTTGDERYDELPWVRQMLAETEHPLIESRLSAAEVPDLADSVQTIQDEPFGGLPTLAYAKLFETARENGVKVLLDGNGMDEQWGGYDYYKTAFETNGGPASVVQGTREKPLKPECLTPEFRRIADFTGFPKFYPDEFRNLQYRDTFFTKIPRAMRYNDRVSMRASTELREPFLDHRLFELAFRQSPERKRTNGTSKKMLREITKKLLPRTLAEAPKRPLQTPQREWLRGELRPWADGLIKTGLNGFGGAWLDKKAVLAEWDSYCRGESDNSFYVWQWISLGLLSKK
jgi:asparagine synthase (glutamine-hydrolysing)